ncbi:MAG TPA: gliding motility-associated C-terminal domain-containing protein, partial [Bacteroidia bacterium]|nr:gliding motility-associated C-terminal domain-containing protein [Bacteroidia bacterium]
GDQITVTMISNATCLFTDTAYSAPFIVNMSSQPGAQVTITSNPATTLCPQQICLFSSAVSNGGSSPVYQWNINGNPGGTNNPQFTAANPSGIMAVYLTVTPSTGCPPQTSNTIIFNIQPQLTPAITLTASQTDSICPGQPVLFQAVSSATGMPPVYSWTLNGSGIGGNVDSLLLPQMNDGDLVNVSVTSSYPCLSPVHTYANPLAFHLYPPTSADLTDGPVEVCFGSPLTLNLTAQGGNSATYSYQWSAGNATGPENIFIPVTSGYYYATVDEACFPPVTDSILVTILPVPVSDFTWSPEKPSIFTPRVQFTDRSVDAHSWQWNLGDQTITNEQNPVHDYLSGGVFPVELITTNDVGCTDTIVRVLEVEEYITVYIPNSFTPNGDSKNDTFGLTGYGTGGYELSVFNRWGQQVFHDSGAQPQWDGSAPDGSPSPAGLYLYLITVNNDSSKKPYTGTVTLVR